MDAGWQFGIDRGATVTGIVARRPDGSLLAYKLLSEATADPPRYRDAAVAGIWELLGVDPDDPIPAAELDVVKMGTSVATNALRIGYQDRSRLFDRHIRLPQMLYERVIERGERVRADGEVLRATNARSLISPRGSGSLRSSCPKRSAR